ncbi:GNAT family N-acetyltransferase [Streptomyces sp. NPDC058195]|uniref:GNAT family N-acetyltransferase n=1 Tax=Streptomyces sp. NPDC058195 TaxID=3346375 RepID=UPI0036E9A5B7
MTHRLPTRLTGHNLTLRPFCPADRPLIAQALDDVEIIQWATGAHLQSLPADERAERWLSTRLAAWSDGIPQFAIADPRTDRLTGYIGLRRIDNGNAEVGSWIAPWARRQGLAANALLTAARWALTPAARGGLGLHRIALHHSTGNPASCTVAARAGLLLEGVMRDAATDHTGTRYDSHLHARLATDPEPDERVPALPRP